MSKHRARVTIEFEGLEGVTFSSIRRKVLGMIRSKTWYPAEDMKITAIHIEPQVVVTGHSHNHVFEDEAAEIPFDPNSDEMQEGDLDSLDDWHPDIVGGRI